MADKRISQLIERVDIANDDVLPIVASGATTTNKVTVSTLQDWMQENLDVGVTSVGITIGSTGTDVNVTGSPVTSSGNITINIPTASATNRGLLSAADWITFNSKQQAITLTTTGTSGAATLVSGTLNIPNYSTDLSGYVTLGTTQTITAQKTFTTSGSSDTMIISHGSGSGFALDVLKAGSGEAIRVTKTSGSGNAMTISGGNFEAPTIVKTGGTSSQFLKADGSVDSSTYLTTGSAGSTYVPYSGAAASVNLGAYSITANAINATGSGSISGQINLRSDAFFSLVNGYGTLSSGTSNTFLFYQTTALGAFRGAILSLNSITESATRTYTLPDASGTLALSTDLGAYLPLTGGTLTGALNGTSASFSSSVSGLSGTFQEVTTTGTTDAFYNANRDTSSYANGLRLRTSTNNNWLIGTAGATTNLIFYNYDLATSPLTLSYSTGAATFSSSVTATSETTNSSLIQQWSYNSQPTAYRLRLNTIVSSGLVKYSFDTTNNSTEYSNNLVLTNGSVGIGTASPGGKLEVNGQTNIINGAINFGGSGSAGSTDPAIYRVAGLNDMAFAIGNTERMRLTSGGDVTIGDSSTSNTGKLNYSSPGVGSYNGVLELYHSTSNVDGSGFANFYRNTSVIGSIGQSGTTGVTYNTTSDYRLKENIKPVENALSLITNLKPCLYNFISEPEREVMGFLAHEVQEIIPQAVHGQKDEVRIEQVEVSPAELDEEGNVITEAVIEEKEIPVYQGIDHSKLVPLLVAAIQEQQEQIKSLTEQVEALKSQING